MMNETFSWFVLPLFVMAAMSPARGAERRGLTAVEGLKVGHFTLDERPTGCTVILAEGGAVGGVDIRGGAPATRETDLLDPVNMVQEIHAVVLSGGSAFGLDSAAGVMRYLEEKKIGFPVGVGVVPIVVGASLFDLGIGGRPEIRPDAACGYAAAKAAGSGEVAEGNVGAGAGATVGKLGGRGRAMKAGIGTAAIELEDGLVVAALVAVNAIGDIIDPATGRTVAGVRSEDGRSLADARVLLRSGGGIPPRPLENTTLGVVATNANLTKAEATKMAQMAHDGYARAIAPAHMQGDGDTIFALATGALGRGADVSRLGALGADVMAQAIVRAAFAAKGIEGLPAAGDLDGENP